MKITDLRIDEKLEYTSPIYGSRSTNTFIRYRVTIDDKKTVLFEGGGWSFQEPTYPKKIIHVSYYLTSDPWNIPNSSYLIRYYRAEASSWESTEYFIKGHTIDTKGRVEEFEGKITNVQPIAESLDQFIKEAIIGGRI